MRALYLTPILILRKVKCNPMKCPHPLAEVQSDFYGSILLLLRLSFNVSI